MNEFAAEPVRVVYFGTPEYAVPTLRTLTEDTRTEIALVVTQPDRPAGRGRTLTPPPVKSAALERGLLVYQPESLRTEAERKPVAGTVPDLFVVAAYGKIFGPKMLALPRLGSVNLHASLLPDYRGASPIAAAILEGQLRTGVTLMQMGRGLDTGPILAHRSLDIDPKDTTLSLTSRLSTLGATLLLDSLDEVVSGQVREEPQDHSVATLTRPLVKADGWIDWRRPAVEIERHVRAMWNWPRAWTTFRREPIQIHEAWVSRELATSRPGTVTCSGEGAAVSTGEGQLILQVVQSAGGVPVGGEEWMRRTNADGERLGATGAPDPPPLPIVRPAAT
jgi:methionyl-tRNA formyltransferase